MKRAIVHKSLIVNIVEPTSFMVWREDFGNTRRICKWVILFTMEWNGDMRYGLFPCNVLRYTKQWVRITKWEAKQPNRRPVLMWEKVFPAEKSVGIYEIVCALLHRDFCVLHALQLSLIVSHSSIVIEIGSIDDTAFTDYSQKLELWFIYFIRCLQINKDIAHI